MEKRLRSSLQSSAEEFLSSATKLGLKSAKASLKTLIHGLASSTELSTSLPLSLHDSISQSITRYRKLSQPRGGSAANTPPTPPTKRLRRSSRNSKSKDDSSGTISREEKVLNNRECLAQKLRICSYVASLCVSHPKKVFSPTDLLPAVRELHDNLILFESDSILQSEIASLSEEWWKEDLPGKESLISQFLPFLVSRSLTLKKKVDVHKVYMLREAFTLFDFEDESIEDLKLLLIRCLIAPLYLKTEDGRKFIAFMFGLSVQLLKEALAMIRSQIPFGRKSTLEAYADILFRAWKTVEGPLRDEIEDRFLQGLIEGSIYASSASFSASIRRVLGGFVNQRTTTGVEKLLFRLAEPVIFRSLQVANSNVRQNALHLLLDMFPLEDPDCNKEAKDTLLDKQFFLLERLLMDECPDVRVVAIEGSCRILHLFWEIIPSSTITKILTKIFDDMSHDSSSEARLSTVNGVIYLLGNPQSHEILKVLLPRLRHLILDPRVSIRAAVVDILLLLRDIRTFQFHKVVSLDILLSTLANDQPHIAQKITKLLIPSYFPSKISLEEACNRCVTLIKRSPTAGARFCKCALSEGASLQSVFKLFEVLINLTLSHKELEAEQIDGLLAAAAYLSNDLVKENSHKKTLKEFFSGDKLRCLFAAATTTHARSLVCEITSNICPDDIGSLLEVCMSLIVNCHGLSENLNMQVEVRSAHKMIMSCNWFDEMFESLTRHLEKAAHGSHTKFGVELDRHDVPSAKRRKSKSSVKFSAKWKNSGGKKTSAFEEDYKIAVGVAWQIKDLLSDENSRKAILASQGLDAAFSSLKTICEVSIMQCMNCDYMDVTPILAFSDLALHISLQNGQNNQGTKRKACLDSAGLFSEATLVEQTMHRIFYCTDRLFQMDDSRPDDTLQSKSKLGKKKAVHKETEKDTAGLDDEGTVIPNQRRISNTMKILTALLKFIVDAVAMDLISYHHDFFNFTLKYLEFIASNLNQYSHQDSQLKEEYSKEVFICLKSSFSYASKLLNLILPTSHSDAFTLANTLLDLVVSLESLLGSTYAARVTSVIKQWLPDLILALGSNHLRQEESSQSPINHDSIALWLSTLAKINVCESSESGSDEEGPNEHKDFPAFEKLIEAMVLLLRVNPAVSDAVGCVFLDAIAVGLEKKETKVVFGLVLFLSLKLVRYEQGEWEEMNMMVKSLQDIYPRMEREAEASGYDDEKAVLRSVVVLLEPVWMRYVGGGDGGTKDFMEED